MPTDKRGPARQMIAKHVMLEKKVKSIEQGGTGNEDSRDRYEAQRYDGERGQAREGKPEQLHPCELGVTRHAVLRLKGHERCAEPDPGIKPLHEAVPLRERIDRIDHFPVKEPEVAGVGRDDHGTPRFQEMIVHAFETALQPAFGTCTLHACDNLVALAPAFQKGRDERRRMLSVGVHQNDQHRPQPL